MVGHQRHEQRREQPGAAPVEEPPELVDQVDGRDAQRGGREALEALGQVEWNPSDSRVWKSSGWARKTGKNSSSAGIVAIAAAWPE